MSQLNPREPDSPQPLLKGLLALSNAGTTSGEHPDDETLAQFVTADLTAAERDALIEHLADCDHCRRIVAAAVGVDHSTEPVAVSFASAKTQAAAPKRLSVSWVLATAAGLLLLVGGISWIVTSGGSEAAVYRRALAALEAGRFDEARSDLDQAIAGGNSSPRLRSLLAQAHRQMPRALALAHAGRLSDFGIEIGGIVARDPAQWPHRQGIQQAEAALAAAGDEPAVLLNRGHLLLSRGDTRGAAEQLAKAERLAPNDPFVLLGQGIVAYLQDDFARAESAFRRAAELAPENTAAQMNLAMTLQEQGKRVEAIDAWKNVLARDDVEAEDREKISREVATLEEMP